MVYICDPTWASSVCNPITAAFANSRLGLCSAYDLADCMTILTLYAVIIIFRHTCLHCPHTQTYASHFAHPAQS